MKGVQTKPGAWALRIAAAAWLTVASAHAQTAAGPDVNEGERDIGAAARAFQEGQKAQLAGDFARAAQLFELADEIAPTPEAIRSAIRNRDAAEHPARAATLALAALARYPHDAETNAAATQLLERVSPSLARLSVTCDAPCALLLDGEAMSARPIESADVYVPPGAHRLDARFDSERKLSRPLELSAGAHEQLELELPAAHEPPPMAIERTPILRDVAPRPAPARAPERDFEGLSPWLAGSAGALTIGCATAALITGLDAMRKRDAYEADPTRERYERGYTSQKWTNALWVATGGLAATSIVLLAFTDWDGDEQRSTATLSLSPLAANFVVRSSLP